jgi:hypothetical protein
MRQKRREVQDREAILAIMAEARICRIGLSDAGQPYVVPMHFGLGKNCLYLHCARAGRKLDILRKNDRVCFEMDILGDIKPGASACGWSTRYRSVIGFGRASLVDDPVERRGALDRIMDHYGAPPPHVYEERSLSLTTIIRIDIDSMTGKFHP